MRVLGIAGSPRQGGNTDILLKRFLEGAAESGAETVMLRACDLKISGCLHCDNCLETGRCSVDDDMQKVYPELEAAEGIVIASPLHFMGISGQLKLLIDRCQALWARKYVLKIPPLGDTRERKGFFISVGGRKAVPNLFDGELSTIKSLFKSTDVSYIGSILVPEIDAMREIEKYPQQLEQAYDSGKHFAAGY